MAVHLQPRVSLVQSRARSAAFEQQCDVFLVREVRGAHLRHHRAIGEITLHVAAREIRHFDGRATLEEIHAFAIGDRAGESVGDDPRLIGLRQRFPHAIAREIEEHFRKVIANHLIRQRAILARPCRHARRNRRRAAVDDLGEFDRQFRQRHIGIRFGRAHEEHRFYAREVAQTLEHLLDIHRLDREELIVRENHARADFIARANHAAFVGRRIFDDGHALLAQLFARFRGEEEIRAFGNHLGAGRSIRLEKLLPIAFMNRGGATAAGNERIRDKTIVHRVAQVRAFG